MEWFFGEVIPAFAGLGFVIIIVLMSWSLWVDRRSKKKTPRLSSGDLTRTFGTMASQLQERAEEERLRNIKLQRRLLELREFLLHLKDKSETKNFTPEGEKFDLREGITALILDKSRWEVSDE